MKIQLPPVWKGLLWGFALGFVVCAVFVMADKPQARLIRSLQNDKVQLEASRDGLESRLQRVLWSQREHKPLVDKEDRVIHVKLTASR